MTADVLDVEFALPDDPLYRGLPRSTVRRQGGDLVEAVLRPLHDDPRVDARPRAAGKASPVGEEMR